MIKIMIWEFEICWFQIVIHDRYLYLSEMKLYQYNCGIEKLWLNPYSQLFECTRTEMAEDICT